MPDINVSRLIEGVEPSELSGSIAERGQNAAKETWANALDAATSEALDIDDRDGAKAWLEGFGAWEREEMDAWSDAELDALLLQFAAGDLRELQDLCPGDGLGDVDWTEAEELSHEGTISGRLYVQDGALYLSACD